MTTLNASGGELIEVLYVSFQRLPLPNSSLRLAWLQPRLGSRLWNCSHATAGHIESTICR